MCPGSKSNAMREAAPSLGSEREELDKVLHLGPQLGFNPAFFQPLLYGR